MQIDKNSCTGIRCSPFISIQHSLFMREAAVASGFFFVLLFFLRTLQQVQSPGLRCYPFYLLWKFSLRYVMLTERNLETGMETFPQ